MPSRRQLLRSSVLSLGTFCIAGCETTDQTRTSATTRTNTATASTTEDSPTQEPTTTEPEPQLRCEVTPQPESGWPFPERSAGRANYATTASGPTTKPTADWTVVAEKPDIGDVRFTRPVVTNDRVYVGRRIKVGPERPLPDEQYVDAYNRNTGKRVWRAAISGTPRTPFVTEDRLFVADDEVIYAFDVATGKQAWKHEPPGGVNSMILTADQLLIASERPNSADEVRAFTHDGDLVWHVTFPSRLAPQISSKVVWADGRAYVTTVEAVLVAIDTDDPAIAWTKNLQDGKDTAPSRLIATPCKIFASTDGVLYTIQRDGTQAWSHKAGIREIATDGRAIYGLSDDGYVRAVSMAGSQNWEQFYGKKKQQADGFFGDPAIDDTTLYAGTLDGKLIAAALEDGQPRWQLQNDWKGQARPALADKTLYTAWSRRLVALS